MRAEKALFNFILSSVLVGLVVVLPLEAFAGRPLGTEDAGIVAKGEFEIELGGDHSKCRDRIRENCLGLSLRYGVKDRLDVGVEIPFLLLKPPGRHNEQGISDLVIGVKYRFLAGKEGVPAFTLRADIKLPNGDQRKGLGSGTTDYTLLGVATHTVGVVTVHYNLGLVLSCAPEARVERTLCYGIAFEYPFGRGFCLVGEILGETTPDLQMTNIPVSTLGGITYEVKPGLVFDVGVNLGLTPASPYYVLTGGVTIASK